MRQRHVGVEAPADHHHREAFTAASGTWTLHLPPIERVWIVALGTCPGRSRGGLFVQTAAVKFQNYESSCAQTSWPLLGDRYCHPRTPGRCVRGKTAGDAGTLLPKHTSAWSVIGSPAVRSAPETSHLSHHCETGSLSHRQRRCQTDEFAVSG